MARPTGPTFEVTPDPDVERIVYLLEKVGRHDLRDRLSMALREVADASVDTFKKSAEDVLPKKGGLGRHVAESRFTAHTEGLRAVVDVEGDYDLGALNRGRARHPVFGHRKTWVNQRVRPGWFTEPSKALRPTARKRLEMALESIQAEFL